MQVSAQSISEKERLGILSMTDSIIGKYNDYGTFSEEYGSFSNRYATLFVGLFEERAILIDDLSDFNPNVTKEVIGVSPGEYKKIANDIYPSGILIADFKREATPKIKVLKDGYEIELTGSKEIRFLLGDRQFTRTLSNYKISLIISKDFDYVKITGTSISGISIKEPPKYYTKGFRSIYNDLPVNDAIIELYIDNELFARKISHNMGLVWFRNIPQFKNASVVVYSINDSTLRFGKQLYLEEVKNGTVLNLPLERLNKNKLVLSIRDPKNKVVSNVYVTYTIQKTTYKVQSDVHGQIELNLLGTGDKVNFTLEKQDYQTSTQSIYIKKQVSQYERLTIYPMPPLRKVNLNSLPNMLFLNGSIAANSQPKLTAEPSVAFEICFDSYPTFYKHNRYRWGYYTSIDLHNISLMASSDGISETYTDVYQDSDGDTVSLVINSKKIDEQYEFNTIGLSVGPTILFPLGNTGIQFKFSAGPLINYIPKINYTTKSGEISIAGRLSEQYYNTVVTDIERYGYGSFPIETMIQNPIAVQKINFGLSAEALLSYQIIKHFEVGLGIKYTSVMTNMMEKDRNFQIARIILNETPIPDKSYYGLMNMYESIKVSSIALQIGIIYSIN
ncbi:MAG: hypothetical protein KGZ82_06925 [Bacteroidales bacterium]|nr:hypothetical protein [Bacteroidales bacterium]